MPNIDALRIVAADADRVLTRDQKRFNSLIGQIEQARTTLKAWQDNIAQYGQAHVQLLMPLQTQLRATRRQWVFVLQALIARRGWTRAERETMNELVCEVAGKLLAADDDDAELRALFAKHAEADFDTERLQALHALKGLTESMTGLDLGDEAGIASEEDLLRRLHQGMQQQAATTVPGATRRRLGAARRRRSSDASTTRSRRRSRYARSSANSPARCIPTARPTCASAK